MTKHTRSVYLKDQDWNWICRVSELNSIPASKLVTIAIGHLRETLEDMKHE